MTTHLNSLPSERTGAGEAFSLSLSESWIRSKRHRIFPTCVLRLEIGWSRSNGIGKASTVSVSTTSFAFVLYGGRMGHTMSKSLTTTRKAKLTHSRPADGWKFAAATTHPGVILNQDFLVPLNLSQHKLAMSIRVPATRIGDIIHGRRAVTPDTALRLARFFGNSPEFWLNLQQMHDLSKTRVESSDQIEREVERYVSAG
jgi:antitoxin HigA-1